MDKKRQEKIEVLDAREAWLLMKGSHRISRNSRANWYFTNLNKNIQTSTTFNEPDNEDPLHIVSVIPTESPEASDGVEYEYRLVPSTTVSFIAATYRVVFILDISPSLCSVDLLKGQVVLDEVYRSLYSTIKSLVKPFEVPGCSTLFRPQLYVSILAYNPLINCKANQVLVQGCVITEDNFDAVLETVRVELEEIEHRSAEAFGKVFDNSQYDDGEEQLTGGLFEDIIESPETQDPSTFLVSPDAGFINMLRYGILALQLLPENSASGIVVITDGVLGLPGASIFESLMTQLRHMTISCSFVQIGSDFHSKCSLGQIPYTDLMHFIATATYGTYFTKLPALDMVDVVTHEMNGVHKGLLTWSFQITKTTGKTYNLLEQTAQDVSKSLVWRDRVPGFGDTPCIWETPLVRKRHCSTKVHTALDNLISCRLREGYMINSVLFNQGGENQIEVKMILPWRHNVRVLYTMKSQWPNTAKYGSTFVEMTVEAAYEFLVDSTSTSKKPFKRTYRTELVNKYWQMLKGVSETDKLLVHLQSFPSNPVYYDVPELVKIGAPLFLRGPASTNVPHVNTQLNFKDVNQFSSFWKPVMLLDGNIWQKWMHTHRIGITLEHDTPLGRYLHIPNSSGRFNNAISCERAMNSLHECLVEWNTFLLLDKHSYIKFIYGEEEDKPPVGFCIVRINLKPPVIVLRLAFLGGTSGQVRLQIVESLNEKISDLRFPASGSDKDKQTKERKSESNHALPWKPPLDREPSEKQCCILNKKPIEKILIRYSRMPVDMTMLEMPPALDQSGQLMYLSSANKTASNLLMTLSRYLYHRRWIWSVQHGTHSNISMQAIGRILSTLAKLRLQEGFHFAHAGSGIVNMVTEVTMTEEKAECADSTACTCAVQYVTFPPYTKTTRDSGSVDENGEIETTEADGELQVITECWVEPQSGLVTEVQPHNKQFSGLNYKQLAQAMFPTDHECISSLITFEHLNLMCQNGASSPTPITYRLSETKDTLEDIRSQDTCSTITTDTSIQHIPFPYDLLKLLPMCQQVQLMFSTFIEESPTRQSSTPEIQPDATKPADTPPNHSPSHSNHAASSPNHILFDLVLSGINSVYDREIDLSQHECDKYLEFLENRLGIERPSEDTKDSVEDDTMEPVVSGANVTTTKTQMASKQSCFTVTQNVADTKQVKGPTAPQSSVPGPVIETKQTIGPQRAGQSPLPSWHGRSVSPAVSMGRRDSRSSPFVTLDSKDSMDQDPGLTGTEEETLSAPRWRCFAKSQVSSHTMLCFIPASFEDVKRLTHLYGDNIPDDTDAFQNLHKVSDILAQGGDFKANVDKSDIETKENDQKEELKIIDQTERIESHETSAEITDETPKNEGNEIPNSEDLADSSLTKNAGNENEAKVETEAKTDYKFDVNDLNLDIPNDNIKSSSRRNSTTESKPKAINLPIFIYNCPLKFIEQQLVNKWTFKRPEDISEDLTFSLSEYQHHGSPRVHRISTQSGEQSEEDLNRGRRTISENERWRLGKEDHIIDDLYGDQTDLKEHCTMVSETFFRCYVSGVFKSLQAGYKIDSHDCDAAINTICEESYPVEIDITQFIYSVCAEVRNVIASANLNKMQQEDLRRIQPVQLPTEEDQGLEGEAPDDGGRKDQESEEKCILYKLSLNQLKAKDTSATDPASTTINNLIKAKFGALLGTYFRPTSDNQEYYYYVPDDSAAMNENEPAPTVDEDDWSYDEFDSDESQEVFESDFGQVKRVLDQTIDEDTQSSRGSYYSDNLKRLMSTSSVEDNLDEDTPLFIHMACTVRRKGQEMLSMPITSLPTHLGELKECLGADTEIDLNDLHITLDAICLTLPPATDLTESKKRPCYTRMMSYQSQISQCLSVSSDKDDDMNMSDIYAKESASNSLTHLPRQQKEAIELFKEQVVWLLEDEIACAQRYIVPVREDMLDMVKNHVRNSKNKDRCLWKNIKFEFVYGSDQSLSAFIEQFEQMHIEGYHLAKEGQYYYLHNSYGSYLQSPLLLDQKPIYPATDAMELEFLAQMAAEVKGDKDSDGLGGYLGAPVNHNAKGMTEEELGKSISTRVEDDITVKPFVPKTCMKKDSLENDEKKLDGFSVSSPVKRLQKSKAVDEGDGVLLDNETGEKEQPHSSKVNNTPPTAFFTQGTPPADITQTQNTSDATQAPHSADVTQTLPAAHVTQTTPAADVTQTTPNADVTQTTPTADVTQTTATADDTQTSHSNATPSLTEGDPASIRPTKRPVTTRKPSFIELSKEEEEADLHQMEVGQDVLAAASFKAEDIRISVTRPSPVKEASPRVAAENAEILDIKDTHSSGSSIQVLDDLDDEQLKDEDLKLKPQTSDDVFGTQATGKLGLRTNQDTENLVLRQSHSAAANLECISNPKKSGKAVSISESKNHSAPLSPEPVDSHPSQPFSPDANVTPLPAEIAEKLVQKLKPLTDAERRIRRTQSSTSFDRLRGDKSRNRSGGGISGGVSTPQRRPSGHQTPLSRSRHHSGQNNPDSMYDTSSKGSAWHSELGYEAECSDSDDEGGMMSLNDSMMLKPHMPEFWLIIRLNHDSADLYFHARDTDESIPSEEFIQQKEVFRDVEKTIKDICIKVNKKLLLEELYNTRTCNKLLVPEADEDLKWTNDKQHYNRGTKRTKSEDMSGDSDNESPEAHHYLAASMKFIPGYFACPCQWQKPFYLHPRVKAVSGRGISRGIQALKSVLSKFFVKNRKNMYVIKQLSNDAVFYLTLDEAGCDTSQTLMPSESYNFGTRDEDQPQTFAGSRSSSIVSLPCKKQESEEDSLSLISGGRTKDQDGDSMSKQIQQKQAVVTLSVYGIGLVGEGINTDLVQVLQKKLDDTVLDVLAVTLSRNPMCKLMVQDIQFIQKPGSKPSRTIHLTIPSSVMLQQGPLGYYFKQNLKAFLFTPNYMENKLENVFRDFSQEGAPPIPEEDVFLYNRRPQSGGHGIACIHVLFVDGMGNKVQLLNSHKPSPQAYKDNLEKSMFDTLVTTSLYEQTFVQRKNPGATSLIRLDIWERGDIDMDTFLIDKLKNALKHAICDVLMEYRLLTAPLSEVPQHYSRGMDSPLHSAPSSPVLTTVAAGPESRSMPPQQMVKKMSSDPAPGVPVTPMEKSSFSFFSSDIFKIKSKDSPSTKPDSVSNVTWQERESQRRREVEIKEKIQRYESGERGPLHPVFGDLMTDWMHFCHQLECPTIHKIELSLSSRFSVDYILKEIQEVVHNLCPDFKICMFKYCEVPACEDTYLPYQPARAPISTTSKDSETSLDNVKCLPPGLPGRKSYFVVVGRNVHQWRASIDYQMSQPDDELLLRNISIIHPKTHKSYQKFNPLQPQPASGSKPDITSKDEHSHAFIPRQRFLLINISDRDVVVHTYNWATDLTNSLEKQIGRLCQWHNARSHVLNCIVSQKMGLFQHCPFGGEVTPAATEDTTANPFTQSVQDIDLLVRCPTLPIQQLQSRSRHASSRQTPQIQVDTMPLFDELYRDAKTVQGSEYNMRDPVHRQGYQTFKLRNLLRAENEKRMELEKIYVMWQHSRPTLSQPASSNTSISEETLDLLKISSRLIHFVATPMLLDPEWRGRIFERNKSSGIRKQESQTSDISVSKPRSRHSSGASIKSRRSDSQDRRKHCSGDSQEGRKLCPEEPWHIELRSSFFTQYISYLKSLGFMEVAVRSSSPRKSKPLSKQNSLEKRGESSSRSKPIHLQKTLPGGIMLIELCFQEVYFCIRVYVFECSRLPAAKHVNPQLAVMFTDECDRFKDLTHLNSFSHDFHLRTLQCLINQQFVFKHGYHITSFLHDFVRFFPYTPSFSWNYIYERSLTVSNTNSSGQQLFEYILKHDTTYKVKAIRMNPYSEDDIEQEPEYSLLTQLICDTERCGWDHRTGDTRNYQVGLVISHDRAKPELGRHELNLRYWVILTNDNVMFPKLTLERKLGVIKMSSCKTFPATGALLSMSPELVRAEVGSLETDMDLLLSDERRELVNPVPVKRHLEVHREIIDYLGFTNAHQTPLYHLLLHEAEVADGKIRAMINSATSNCRRDILWECMLEVGDMAPEPSTRRRNRSGWVDPEENNSRTRRLSFSEFEEMLRMVKKVPLWEVDKNLRVLSNMGLSWYQTLLQVLTSKYSESKRVFASNDNMVQYLVVLNSVHLDTCMLVTVDTMSSKTELCVVYKDELELAGTSSTSNLAPRAVQNLVEGFVNTCCYHMWSKLLS